MRGILSLLWSSFCHVNKQKVNNKLTSVRLLENHNEMSEMKYICQYLLLFVCHLGDGAGRRGKSYKAIPISVFHGVEFYKTVSKRTEERTRPWKARFMPHRCSKDTFEVVVESTPVFLPRTTIPLL